MRYILILLLGVLLGGGLVFYFLVGAPRSKTLPGVPVKAPDTGGDPPGTAVVSLDEKFFDTALGAIFRDLQPPVFPLHLGMVNTPGLSDGGQIRYAMFQSDCTDQIQLLPEGSGIVSGVHFTDRKIVTPLAFTGSYNAPVLGCLKFRGWANANMEISFDQPKQTIYGRINVESVNLEGVQPGANQAVTSLVQGAINQRVNPLELVRPQQLTIVLPVQASNGTLKAQVKDVRAEISNGILKLHISYEFKGEKNQ
jgi:hypothetical protein